MKENNHKIIIAGAGPGAADLITIRAVEAIKNADIIIYAGSLVNEEILNYAKSEAKLFNSANMSLDKVINLMEQGYARNKKIVRLHTGDPAIYGAINEQMLFLDEKNIPYEIIPGVSSALATAAELKTELTMPGITQTVIFTRKAGRTPVPSGESIVDLAKNNSASFAVFLSVNMIDDLVDDFYQAGRSPDTPIAVVYRATWNNQKIIRGTLQNITNKVKDNEINRQAMIIVGEVLSRSGDKSLLYDEKFAHGYRNKKLQNLYHENVAIYCITQAGAHKALEIATGLSNATVWIPKKFEENISSDHFKRKNDKINYFSSSQLAEVIAENWGKYSGHIFVMASGIVIRKICKLVDSKLTDPAVVCCDEKGNNVISLLSGHIGGANRLAKVVAGITMGNVAITTATDVNNLIAFDEMAKLENYSMLNPKSIKILNMLLLENRKIGVVLPIKIFEKYYQGCSNIELIESASSKQLNDLINEKYFDGLVVLKNVSGKNFSCNQENILWLESKH